MAKDTLYNSPHGGGDPFSFDAHVAEVFSDMIERSVPGYDLTLEMIAVIARHYGQAGSQVYDLGCSLGASTLSLRHNLPLNCSVIAIDSSPSMVERCRYNMQLDGGHVSVEVIEQDILNASFVDASVSVMNFTLQFIAPGRRLELLTRIADATRPGGVLVLSEKIALPEASEQAALTELHHEFKRYRGYSDLEIAQKRSALEDVLIPETAKQHRVRLLNAGFTKAFVWFQCFTFVSMVAVK